jgi:hypothetical protein
MITLEEAKELLGGLPKEVDKDSPDYDEYYVKPYLENTESCISSYGTQWCKEHAKMLNSQWE